MANISDLDSTKMKGNEESSEACPTDVVRDSSNVEEEKENAAQLHFEIGTNQFSSTGTAKMTTIKSTNIDGAYSTSLVEGPSNVEERIEVEIGINNFFPTETSNITFPESIDSDSVVEGTANGIVSMQNEQSESCSSNDIDGRFSTRSTNEPSAQTSPHSPADIEDIKNSLADLLLQFSESPSDQNLVARATTENSPVDSTTDFIGNENTAEEPISVDLSKEKQIFRFNADRQEEPTTFKWTKKNANEPNIVLSKTSPFPKSPKTLEYYKEVFSGSLTFKPPISSCLPDLKITPNPSTSSCQPDLKKAEPLSSDYKEFVPRSFSVESPTPCIPEPKEVSVKPSFTDFKEFVPRSFSVETSCQPLKSDCKEFVPKSLRVEAPTSSLRFKPEEVLKTTLSTNVKEFVPRSFTVGPSTSLCLPREVLMDSSSLPAVSDKVLARGPPVHSFLATIDALLLVLEGTLAGAYRIAQNYTGPRIPVVVENTMHSIRLALETLRVHFAYTNQESFEPLASILRDLLSPAVNLFSSICPELSSESTDFYPPLEVPEVEPDVPNPPGHTTRPEFLISAQQIDGTTVYDYTVQRPLSAPRIPLYMDFFQDPNMGVFVTPDGLIRMQLSYTIQIDITINGAISVRNTRDKTIVAISACGNFSGIASSLCRVYQHGKVTELRITDMFAQKNMYAKIGVRGVQFGGTGTPANLQLKDTGETTVAETNFKDLDYDFISEVFIKRSMNGPAHYEACCNALQEGKSKTLTDGSVHFNWRDIKITQYRNGELMVIRRNGDFIIWCSPEIINPHSGTEKKGVIKVVTPMSRAVSTVMTTPVLDNEKFFLANLGNQWVYYNARDFIISNEVHSVGYRYEEENVNAETRE